VDTLVCISHLRWDFVWQRPQHLLKRMSNHFRIVFVEEPITTTRGAEPRLEISPAKNAPDITTIRLIQPVENERWVGHGDPLTQTTYSNLLVNYLKSEGISNPLLWLYTPMALDFADTIKHKLLIFDVMDQLSAFKGAPAQLVEKEKVLLQKADIVFTGGASLYRAKAPFNANTHLFPSGVEPHHFARAARRDEIERPADMTQISAPILGYFGVIDERMDLALLAHLSSVLPAANIVLLGPVVKIEQSDLPQAPNLHYLGGKSYDELPAYLAHFDVALLPFAINEATRYLSPTKTLEYMAAHKPIVSTPIHDVIELYGEVVRIANSPAEFVEKVQDALTESAEAGKAGERFAKEEELLRHHTWDYIARTMNKLIVSRLENRSYANNLRSGVEVTPAG
jgi:glycosyltransferase involved in cell wall biosynthesis